MSQVVICLPLSHRYLVGNLNSISCLRDYTYLSVSMHLNLSSEPFIPVAILEVSGNAQLKE